MLTGKLVPSFTVESVIEWVLHTWFGGDRARWGSARECLRDYTGSVTRRTADPNALGWDNDQLHRFTAWMLEHHSSFNLKPAAPRIEWK